MRESNLLSVELKIVVLLRQEKIIIFEKSLEICTTFIPALFFFIPLFFCSDNKLVISVSKFEYSNE